MESDPASTGPALRALFVAVDGGARAAIAPISERGGCDSHDVSIDDAEAAAYWSKAIALEAPELLVVGTSDSTRGRRIEGAARRAAHSLSVPIVAIEDFPGNYYEVEGGAATAVIVESLAARELCKRRLGLRAPALEIVAAARYDPYRARLDELRNHTVERWTLAKARPPTVMWAGQPETDDCMRTLAVLLPVLRRLGSEVAFKAHPRDAGYAAGTYRDAFEAAGVPYRDVTALDVEDALNTGPRLVVTQFSSVAIEAGFFGIPSLWILLPDAGGARLRQKKNYDVPPLALAGGAATVNHADALSSAVELALLDESTRANLMRSFDDYFKVRHCATAALLQTVSAYSQSQISPK